ncbi:MAG: response regulator [Anaerolineae bacterium]|nr:response regulator [Anaerolineae bacterium]MBN8620404.1 response regulator [Anaerolineae bacterium]
MANDPILVVEDDPDGQEVVARILKQVKQEVQIASTAEEAWEMLQQTAYAGAIIDLALPGQDGFQLLNAIRNDARISGLRCIAVTAFHTPELKYDALRNGFNGYFAKPLNRTLFLGAIEELIFK